MARTKVLVRVLTLAMWIASVASMLGTFGLVAFPSTGLILPALATPGFVTVGTLLVWHRPRNILGWLIIGMGAVPAIGYLLGIQPPEFHNGATLICLVLVLVVFPEGKLQTRMWAIPVTLLVAGWTVSILFPRFVWSRSADFEVPLGVAAGLIGVLWCAAAPLVRYRRSTGIERLQLRWLGLVAAMTAAAATVALTGAALQLSEVVVLPAVIVTAIGATLGIPASILVAVLRYRLYSIDRIVSRTISYTIVVAVLGLVYGVGSIWLPTALVGEGSPLFVAGSTLAAAALFQPLRSRVRRHVDRRFNRPAYEAEAIQEEFAVKLHEALDVETLSELWVGAISQSLQPASAGIWINPAKATRR
ncbi:MAG: hypothetical protein R3246_04890 [Acidimicrobiia bacterium]|nr:hypothetical protein [Acidimicrobiia bacterium]